MTSFALFVVDDEDIARQGIALALKKDYRVFAFATAEQALEAMVVQPPDLILLDVGLPGMNGLEALEQIKRTHPDILVIMITAWEDVHTVVTAMKRGAYDYFVKPLDMNGLLITVRNALETLALKKENRLLQHKYIDQNLPRFVGQSKAIEQVMTLARQVAQSIDTPVLVLGETGTGKELIAQTIHYLSPNFKGNLVPVNCAAIARELIESELFGYEKGAFSGAEKSGKMGLVEKAADGTLFLDEVGDMGAETQAKLLRFLESGEYYRVGGSQRFQVKTRVVSATNKDLSAMVQQGLFRSDLYYRLAVVKIELPPLARRPEDIVALARFFLSEYNAKFGKTFTSIASEAEQALVHRRWKGNVRELKNIIERSVLLGSGHELTKAHLGLTPATAEGIDRCAVDGIYAFPELTEEGFDLSDFVSKIEYAYFEQAMAMAGGNLSKAARLLHLSRDQLRYRFHKPQP